MHEIPGVERAAVALTLPFERALNNGFRFVGGDQQGRIVNTTYVTPEYFETLRIPILRGRTLAAGDTATSDQVIVVNEAFVRRYSPDADPLGRQMTSSGAPRTIVGIVGDIQQKVSFGNFGPIAPTPAAFVPAAQLSGGFFTQVHTWFSPSWIVRLSGPQEGVVRQMETAVRNVDPLLPFAKVRTLDDVRGEAVKTERAQAMLLGTLAGLALVLAAVGLYGLVASSVAERTRELGIRIALGATRSRTIADAAAQDSCWRRLASASDFSSPAPARASCRAWSSACRSTTRSPLRWRVASCSESPVSRRSSPRCASSGSIRSARCVRRDGTSRNGA
jgi:hypothetical protein